MFKNGSLKAIEEDDFNHDAIQVIGKKLIGQGEIFSSANFSGFGINCHVVYL